VFKSLQGIVAVSMIVTGVTLGARAANAQSAPVIFRGLPHTSVGAATLWLDPTRNALDVRGLGSAGDDGVAVRKADATSWTARVGLPVYSGFPLSMSWSALADGRAIGSGLIEQSGDNFAMSAVFTGATFRPTFSAQVYNNGQLVGAIGGLPPTAGPTYFPVDICRKVPEFCEFVADFHTLEDGACMIKVIAPLAGPIRLPNGAIVTGNEIRLVEEVRYAGHYPYLGFDTLTMRSAVPSFAILSETLR